MSCVSQEIVKWWWWWWYKDDEDDDDDDDDDDAAADDDDDDDDELTLVWRFAHLKLLKVLAKRRNVICNIKIHVTPGPRLNIKTVLSTYGDFHVKDKTAVRTSYL